MATDFAVSLRRVLTSYLAGLRDSSPNAIASYRDTFKLLIAWFRDERSVPRRSSRSTTSTTAPDTRDP
jgi:integrase/recombinase XerD